MGAIPLGDVPAHHAERLGHDRLCLRHGAEELTWGELSRRATRRAHALRDAGVGKNDIVTLSLPNSNAFYELTFAIWKLGATPSSVSWRLPTEELKAIVQVANPKLVIASDPDIIAATGAFPADYGLKSGSDAPMETVISDHWKAMTSGGSTGRPKVIVDHQPAVIDVGEPGVLKFPGDEAVINPGPCYHNAPFSVSHNALARGNAVIGMAKFDPEETLRLIEAHRVSWIFMVPTMMNRIWRLPEAVRDSYDISSLDTVWHSAAPMPAWLKEAWIDWIGPEKIWEMYGGTEGQGYTILDGNEWLEHRGSVGRPLGCEIRILDDAGRQLPRGEIGEVFMRPDTGSGSTYHYIGAAPKAAGEFETIGDYGWLDGDGYLFIADRRTDLIISGGSNVYPAEVEAALLEHPDVEDAVVIGLPDDDLGARVHAIIKPVGNLPSPLSGEIVVEYLRDRIVRYKIPRSFEFIFEAIRDDAGKVRRSKFLKFTKEVT